MCDGNHRLPASSLPTCPFFNTVKERKKTFLFELGWSNSKGHSPHHHLVHRLLRKKTRLHRSGRHRRSLRPFHFCQCLPQRPCQFNATKFLWTLLSPALLRPWCCYGASLDWSQLDLHFEVDSAIVTIQDRSEPPATTNKTSRPSYADVLSTALQKKRALADLDAGAKKVLMQGLGAKHGWMGSPKFVETRTGHASALCSPFCMRPPG